MFVTKLTVKKTTERRSRSRERLRAVKAASCHVKTRHVLLMAATFDSICEQNGWFRRTTMDGHNVSGRQMISETSGSSSCREARRPPTPMSIPGAARADRVATTRWLLHAGRRRDTAPGMANSDRIHQCRGDERQSTEAGGCQRGQRGRERRPGSRGYHVPRRYRAGHPVDESEREGGTTRRRRVNRAVK